MTEYRIVPETYFGHSEYRLQFLYEYETRDWLWRRVDAKKWLWVPCETWIYDNSLLEVKWCLRVKGRNSHGFQLNNAGVEEFKAWTKEYPILKDWLRTSFYAQDMRRKTGLNEIKGCRIVYGRDL